MILRPYQSDAVANLRRSIARGNRRPLLQLPTGGGKTVIASEIVRSAKERGKRVLFLAPRRELIYQASSALAKSGLAHHGVIMAGEPMHQHLPIQVASLDTLNARAMRSSRITLPAADVLIVDEAHLSIAPSRAAVVNAYPEAVVVGLTATPARGDGRGLGEIYDDLVLGCSMRQLIEDGFLAPCRYFAPTKPDLDGLKVARGDYVVRQLSERMNQPQLIGDILGNWQRLARDRQTVIFCVDRAHARAVHGEFKGAGYRAEYLDGETPTDERKAILARMDRGESQVLVNVFVATFGLDIPSLSCAVLARPTRSIVLYLQTVGRVLRTCEGKKDAVVIDHAGAVDAHGFVDDPHPWSLDSRTTLDERRKESQQGEPKEITCGDCGTVFRGRRDCPACGAEIVPKSKAIPTYGADLQEVKPEKVNRDTSWGEKIRFMGELKTYARAQGHNPGWCAHKYRERFGVWPNDPRVKNAQHANDIRLETRSWIKSRLIAWAKRKAA